MADQPITGLPTKTASGVATTDKMLGIDSAEGYQILVQDVAKYIIENCNVSTLAGAVQTPKQAIDGLNSKLTLTGEYSNAESFSSAEILGSKLDALLNEQVAYNIGCYKLSCTASFGVFQSGYDYCVQITRASSLSFVIAEFTPIDDGLIKILGKRRTDGWSFELAPSRTEINTLNSNTVNTTFASSNTSKYTLNNVRLVRRGSVYILLGEAKCISPATDTEVNIVSSNMVPVAVGQTFVPAWGSDNASKDALGVHFAESGIFLSYGTAGCYYEFAIPMFV